MLEKVLKRLCPCYFARTDESELSGCQTPQNKDSDSKPTSRSIEKSSNSRSDSYLKNETSGSGTGSGTIDDNWKGTLNIIQPQPIYAFPIDLKKPIKRNQKALLKPPLYWKKTMKNLYSEGPTVFQQLNQKKLSLKSKKEKKQKHSKPPLLKHSETEANLSSLTSATTVDVRWLKSASVSSLPHYRKTSDYPKNELSVTNPSDGTTTLDSSKDQSWKKNWNCLKCQVYPDVSHGVILLTAAYFNKKKICIININRLEKLAKKGREGNSYYTIVKLAVLPSEKYIKCSKVLNKSSNPEVKQDFSFAVKEVSGKVLRISVFDASLQKQHEAIGHALLTLEDIASDQPKKYRIKLYRRTQPHICPGNLALTLKYSSEEDKFTIVVEKAKNLSLQRDKNVKLNTYVKATMYAYGEKVKSKKSLVVFDSKDPNYNSTFTFRVRSDQIDHLSVAIIVRLKGLVNDITIGRLNFGPFFYLEHQKLTPWGRVFLKEEIVSHWYRMYL